jgi:hypothetical protein
MAGGGKIEDGKPTMTQSEEALAERYDGFTDIIRATMHLRSNHRRERRSHGGRITRHYSCDTTHNNNFPNNSKLDVPDQPECGTT